MTAPELKPCPFCGGEAYLSSKMLDERYGYAEQSEVWCKNCRVGYVFQDSQNPKGGYALEGTGSPKSIAAWNRRADLAAVETTPAQCCMCGKVGLSTAEDGGPECELHDGRWVCSRKCYDDACSLMVPPIETTPDPRDAVIARLVEAVENLLRNYLQDELDEPDLCVNDDHWTAIHDVDAALAAAKAVQK